MARSSIKQRKITDALLANQRIRFTADTNFYIDPNLGTDSPEKGLSTGAGAFKSLQYALNTVANNYDLNGFRPTFWYPAGTFVIDSIVFAPVFLSTQYS